VPGVKDVSVNYATKKAVIKYNIDKSTLDNLKSAGYALILKALSLGPSSNVIPITNSATPFVVLFGVIFLGERSNLLRKFTSGFITLIAIYLMR